MILNFGVTLGLSENRYLINTLTIYIVKHTKA